MHLILYNIKKIKIDHLREKCSRNRYRIEIFRGAFRESFFLLWTQSRMGVRGGRVLVEGFPDR